MYSIGIDVGGMSVKIGLVKDGEILSKTSVKTNENPYKTLAKALLTQKISGNETETNRK